MLLLLDRIPDPIQQCLTLALRFTYDLIKKHISLQICTLVPAVPFAFNLT